MRQRRWVGGLLWLAGCLGLAACGRTERVSPLEERNTAASPELPAEAPEATAPEKAAAWRIETSDGNTELWAETRSEGYKLYDGADQVVGEVKVEADRVKVKDAQDQIVWKIKPKDDGGKLYDSNDREIAQIKRKEGGYRIKDVHDREVGAIKPKDEGSFKVYDAQEQVLGKVKPKARFVELEDADGKRVAEFSGDLTPQAASFWALDGFDRLQRAGLMVYVMKFE